MKKPPFQVMCVSSKPLAGPCRTPFLIESGSEYTVVRIIPSPWGAYYELDFHLGVAYHPVHFAILPSTTEEVGIEQQQEAIIYQR